MHPRRDIIFNTHVPSTDAPPHTCKMVEDVVTFDWCRPCSSWAGAYADSASAPHRLHTCSVSAPLPLRTSLSSR